MQISEEFVEVAVERRDLEWAVRHLNALQEDIIKLV